MTDDEILMILMFIRGLCLGSFVTWVMMKMASAEVMRRIRNEFLQASPPTETVIISKDDLNHLDWIYNRMLKIHQERDNVDYMIKFKQILDSARKAKP